MARPTTTPFQERLYAALEPHTDQDELLGWPLLIYLGAIASMFDQIESYARDGDQGQPGWSIIVDPDRVPIEAIPWLALITGTTLQLQGKQAGESDTEYVDRLRQQVADANNLKRGTIGSIIGAAKATLTGTQTVLYRERDGGAYNLTILTIDSETPDTTLTLNEIEKKTPAGLILDYAAVSSFIYLMVHTDYAAYTDLPSNYSTYDKLRKNAVGT
jgi:hypothetical protein